MLNELQSIIEAESMKGLSLEQDQRTATFVREMIKRGVKKVMKKQFPNVEAEITGEAVLVEGATSAVTVQVDSQLQFMFKFDIERVPREIEGYEIMERLLPNNVLKPLYYDANAGLLCIPFLTTAKSLHDIIKDRLLNERDILTIYADLLRKMLALWSQSYIPSTPDPNQFVQRLRRRTKQAERLLDTGIAGQAISFSEILRLSLQVNGVDYPPLVELLDQTIQLILANPAPCSVTAHRDEHAKNILVDLNTLGDIPSWYLIDMPNVSMQADWVWSIAKMRHWWQVYYYLDQVKRIQPSQVLSSGLDIKFEIRSNKIFIQYNLNHQIPSICQLLDQKVESFAKQVGYLLKDDGWPERYQASLFLVSYGGISFHHECQHVIPILLGEAVKGLHSKLNHLN
jgi:hypothetical protein